MNIYNWQKKQWDSVIQRKAVLPHAILLRGRAGVGKHDFALSLSNSLLCKQPSATQQACGQCSCCTWLKEGTHPDFKLITPEEGSDDSPAKRKASKKSQISVAQIRQLYDYLSLTSHQADGYRIILISPSEALNIAAANALLKMLEEPPPKTLFLLVSSQPQRLLPTIISRCQILDLPIPAKADAINWLKDQGLNNPEAALAYAGGAPLKAFRMQGQIESNAQLIKQLALGGKLDPFASAPSFLAVGMEQAVDLLQKWTFDLINFKLIQHLHYHLDQVNALQALSKTVNLNVLLRFQRGLVDAKRSANHPLSNEMQLENVLLQYTRLFTI